MPPKNFTDRLTEFFSNLTNTKVSRAAVAYVVVCLGVISVTTATFPVFGIPNWATQLVIGLLFVGFPVVLLLAWAFMTPQASKRLFLALLITVAIAAGGLLLFRFWGDTDGSRKFVAILPFKNEGGSKDSPLFAGGIHDDILNRLAALKELNVISRSSVMLYGDKKVWDLAEIGKRLGVSHIVEGSVSCAENRVDVHVQLFDVVRDKSIWMNDYPSTRGDFLSVHGKLASDLVAKLHVSLTQKEKARLGNPLTNKLEAWKSYMRGREAQLPTEISRDNYSNAVNFYQQAIEQDAEFVLARARLSFMQVLLYQFFEPTSAHLLAEARKNADKALKQDPSCAEAHLASAKCAQQEKNKEVTSEELGEAVRLLPNDASIRLAAAVTQQQLGWEKEASENYRRAAELSPLDARLFFNYGHMLYEHGQEKEAREVLDRALKFDPDSVLFRALRAVAEISWTGDTGSADVILAGMPPGQDSAGRATSAYCTLAILKRNFPEALRLLRVYPEKTLSTIESGGLGEQQQKVEAEATVRFYAGDYARACEYFESLRPDYEVAVRDNPDSVSGHAALALLCAWMSRCQVDKGPNETDWKERAKAEAARIMELNASAPVPVKRAYILHLAKIYAWSSEPDLALQQIEQYLAFGPSGYSHHNFRLDPVWDPLRSDQRFQKLVAKK
jgi:TolB-like protein/Flp pilus assembly protein TadD